MQYANLCEIYKIYNLQTFPFILCAMAGTTMLYTISIIIGISVLASYLRSDYLYLQQVFLYWLV